MRFEFLSNDVDSASRIPECGTDDQTTDSSVEEIEPFTKADPSGTPRNASSGFQKPVLQSPSMQLPRVTTISRVKTDRTQDDEDSDPDDLDQNMQISALIPRPKPTFEGFKKHMCVISPKLPLYLAERLGQEQLRRYKKLLEFRIKHLQDTQVNKCESGVFCAEKDRNVKYFSASGKQEYGTANPYKFGSEQKGQEDESMIEEGLSEGSFPSGIPMPPVSRFPAEFECPICFTVRKIQKPSDWVKHVHEDVQPFTCTFPGCPEPKSFKRKADWVRHENERHRQLEWWECSMPGCSHKCFRRDNFIQHLVREHKLSEPKVRSSQTAMIRGPRRTSTKRGSGEAPETDIFRLVEIDRHETEKKPADEPCRFCGNVCSSYKKLTVHLAKHMEQLSLPVLEVVADKEIDVDTVVSPINVSSPETAFAGPVRRRTGTHS